MRKHGFTLVEMLVAIAIITIMVMLVLLNTNRTGSYEKVNAAANLIVDTTKETRSKAISVEQLATDVYPSYGVHMDKGASQIIVFADCIADDNADGTVNNLDTFSFSNSSNQCAPASPSNGLVKTETFPVGTKISAIRSFYPQTANGALISHTESKVDILFLRPEPTIWITLASGLLLPVGRIEVDVTDSANRYLRTVTFYSTGEFSL